MDSGMKSLEGMEAMHITFENFDADAGFYGIPYVHVQMPIIYHTVTLR